MAKELLHGVPPPRPLCLPIVFSLGAKVENVTPDVFRNNPTKITSALRQMRAPLRADGVTCTFDPWLEVEALGAVVRRTGDGSCSVHWPGPSPAGELPDALCAPEELAQRGRVPIACEVLRRMNAVLNRDFLLMAGVTGPMTLAVTLCGARASGDRCSGPVADAAKELASAVATQLSTAYLEAGADLLLIHEAIRLEGDTEIGEEWASLLAPAVNVTRFYEALPMVQFVDGALADRSWDRLGEIQQDCIVCVPLETAMQRQSGGRTREGAKGIALPVGPLSSENFGEEALAALRAQMSELNPAVITTTGDVPPEADLKRLTQLLGQVARAA
jgi:hypothetical protein